MGREDFGYDGLGRTGDSIFDVTTGLKVTQPASGDTVELYNTLLFPVQSVRTIFQAPGKGKRYKMFILNIESSADSAANGIELSESDDGGVTFKTAYVRTYVAATDLRLKLFISLVGGYEYRIRYINSAAALTTFRWSLLADTRERGF